MSYKILIWIVLVLAQSIILFYSQIEHESLTDIVNMSVTYSGIVFAINGIWIALLFPQVFEKIYKKDESLNDREEFLNDSYNLLRPLILGTLLLISSIIFRIIIEIRLPFFLPQNWMLSLRLPIIVIILELISYNLFLVLKPGVILYLEAYKVVKKEGRRKRMFSNNQMREKE